VRGKVSPKIAMFGHKLPKSDLGQVKEIFDTVESRPKRDELNLYVTGYEDEPEPAGVGASAPADQSPTSAGPGEDDQTGASASGASSAASESENT